MADTDELGINFKLWEPSEEELDGLNNIKARNLILECFAHAQFEVFRCVDEVQKGHEPSEEVVRADVERAIRLAFEELNLDYENPTKEDLLKVCHLLADRVKMWGTPESIIKHHLDTMCSIIERLD